ncbi:hypothetical protein D9V37_03245 [Nocardioides mangrovicus]|uniref:Calcineurin-like phosphoesterase domain-containing protein n=1 Tax=Nocardioides mangrovicus TaxID=2478913 RepID=A0A3L8P6T4_9ACTN|nr:metallophosphoesterase [Nocardioides mangrovicus]RLV50961.1 hypothetical protein D9V37_03245 [Nocardioides mangrovicus]
MGRLARWGRTAGRGAALVAVVAVVVAPLALAWGVTTTRVHDTIGVSPATFSLSTDGRSALELGLAGTVYVPRAKGPFGLVARVDAPTDADALPDGTSDLASLVSPQMLEVYAGLYHHPGRAIDGYVDLLRARLVHDVLLAEVLLTVVGSGAVLVLRRVLPLGEVGRGRTAGVVLLALVLTTASAVAVGRVDRTPASGASYPLPVLDDTAAAGATTDSPVLRLLLGDAVTKIRVLTQRQTDASDDYRTRASAQLDAQAEAMAVPEKGETAVLMQSDMHCNEVMIALQTQVRRMLEKQAGSEVPAVLAIAGDLTTNGTAAERDCVRAERAVAGTKPVVAVTGNHESDQSVQQMKSAGMDVLDGSTRTVGGLSFLGAPDPERTELFGASHLCGTATETSMGTALRRRAEDDKPTIVLVHEAYAAKAFLGTEENMRTFDGSDVFDVPASAVFYGHWHRSVPPRVVQNSDGTWTLVMELDTSGGAIATPTFNHFSTPWTPPAQEASFPVVFVDDETRLVTGYQLYSFATDGTVTVQPRVDVGPTS